MEDESRPINPSGQRASRLHSESSNGASPTRALRILVGGGAGFIGSHLVEQLLAAGHYVTIVDNFLTGRYVNLAGFKDHPRVAIVHHDLTKPLSPPLSEARFDHVYNLASPASPRGYGKYPFETHLVNSVGTHQLLQLAQASGARFLQASTSEIYGDPLVHPQVETYWGNVNPNGPRSCYDEGKRFSESLTMEFVRQFRLDARIARIFNTYGPRSHPQDGRVVPNFCVQALQNKPITLYGDGLQTRSFCYVDDLVRGLIALMETDGIGGEVINLGNPNEFTVRELAEQIVALTESSSPIHYEPLPVDDPTRRQPDISKAGRLLGWQPTIPLSEGLRPTIKYFASTLNEIAEPAQNGGRA